jgi:hypothetical protein
MKISIMLAAILFIACQKEAPYNGLHSLDEYPYFSVRLERDYVDPADTNNIITEIPLAYGWRWDQMNVSHANGMFTIAGKLDSVTPFTVRWRADTLFGHSYPVFANDTALWPRSIPGAFTLLDSSQHFQTVAHNRNYSFYGAFYHIDNDPDPWTEIVFSATLDTGRYKGYRMIADLKGPAKTFK